MLTSEHLWPMDDVWKYHAGGGEFRTLTKFTEALEARYGKAADVADYARKAQALTYEGERAMFEGYARNKYKSTGVIQWMLNNAWPSLIWHLYDYYLRPGGGYFGTKKACEPIHVQYSYDDRSIALVNDTQTAVTAVTVSASVIDFSLKPRFTRDATVDLPADAVVKAIALPSIADLTPTYFLRLSARDRSGKVLSTNFYWLSTQEDVLDWPKSTWYYTPTTKHADLTALASLPATTVRVGLTTTSSGHATVHVENTGRALAFQIRLTLTNTAAGEEILPVFWSDNYIALMPGEARDVTVEYRSTATATVHAKAWNSPDERASNSREPREGPAFVRRASAGSRRSLGGGGSEPAKRRASERVGESEGRTPSDETGAGVGGR
jgi:exo-1,4-beta-D-glucosaminidase